MIKVYQLPEDPAPGWGSPEEWAAFRARDAEMRRSYVTAEELRRLEIEQTIRDRIEYVREHERLQTKAEERSRQRRAEEVKQREEKRARYEAWLERTHEEYLRREKLNASFAEAFKAAGGKERWAAIERAKGRGLKSIGDQIGRSPERIRQMLLKYDERIAPLARRRRQWSRTNLGRPVDMGGPRDVWLEYGVSPDPRLDNMTPVLPAGTNPLDKPQAVCQL